MSAAAKCNSKKADIKQMEEKSNERLSRLFKACDETYFGGKMSKNVKVRWSKRMTECAGTTLSAFKNQPITISLSRPILELRPLNDLLETLLHEMIHAFLWAEKIIEKEEHGPIFHEHMKRVQKLAGVDLQICHDFEDECGLLLKHVWRCNGPCRKSAPNRGIIRRAINREPSSSEKWFREHRLECGGTFIKIKEPNSTKVEFDYRLDDEIETFLASAFPKCTKPNFLENVKNAMSFDTTRERRRRSLSQTEEESPLKKNSPVEKISQKSSKKKNKDNLQIPKTVSKKQQKSNIKKNEDNLKVPKKVSKKALNLNSDLKTDEVSPLKIPKYVWQCDGKCKEESPNFGKVVRCINKPPSQREKWFSKHHKECGGNFVKI